MRLAVSRHLLVSTHSRLKAAGDFAVMTANGTMVSTHSRLKAAGCGGRNSARCAALFQHTAA